MGRGGGHYDRTYAYLKGMNTNVIFIGFAYAKQLIDEIPRSSHDLILEKIVTEKNIVNTKRKH